MEKSTYSREYALLINLLRGERTHAGITQAQLAERLQQTQSFISKCERLERRLDVIELRVWCEALGTSLSDFIVRFDAALAEKAR